jgi:hypothetical protein
VLRAPRLAPPWSLSNDLPVNAQPIRLKRRYTGRDNVRVLNQRIVARILILNGHTLASRRNVPTDAFS